MSKGLTVLIGVAIPVALFLFKNVLPILFKKVYTSRGKWVEILIESMQFPQDLIMVAITYTLYKTLSCIYFISNSYHNTAYDMIDNSQIIDVKITEEIANATTGAIVNTLFTVISILILPFIVAIAKITEKYYLSKKKRWIILLLSMYIFSSVALFLSIK